MKQRQLSRFLRPHIYRNITIRNRLLVHFQEIFHLNVYVFLRFLTFNLGGGDSHLDAAKRRLVKSYILLLGTEYHMNVGGSFLADFHGFAACLDEILRGSGKSLKHLVKLYKMLSDRKSVV